MSSIIAIVKSIVGQVFALSPEGTRRLLIEGDRLFAGDQVMTGQEGMISLELSDGRILDLGRDSQWTASDDTPQVAATPSAELSASELQQAISLGLDPTAELEATAAGAGGAGGGTGGAAGGGHSYVLLDATAQQLDATVGFETAGLGLAGQAIDQETGADSAVTAEAPPAIDTTPPVVSISIDLITADNTLNAQELFGDIVTVTGSVGGEAKLGDSITLNVGGSLYNGSVIERPDGSLGFEINVGTGDLRDASSITATLTSVDGAGNSATSRDGLK